MENKEVLEIFRTSGALLEGHFLLRSGLHSDRFFQAALVLQYPEYAQKLCSVLAANFKGMGVETVLSPAVGGLIVGHELARALGARAIFAEKENDGLVLRRGFSIRAGEKVVVAEDVVTKGGRALQSYELAKSYGADVVGICSIVDRSGGTVSFDVPFFGLLRLEVQNYEPNQCPLCAKGIPFVKPGSK